MTDFGSKICRLCKSCSAKEPWFCVTMHSIDKVRFSKMIKYIMVLRFYNKEKFAKVTSFAAFVGLFCNSRGSCKFCTPDCASIANVIKCYEMFLQQSGVCLSLEEKANIYAGYSGINMKAIGLKYKVPKKPFRGVSKKVAKRMNKMAEKAIHSVAVVDPYTGESNYKEDKKKKEPKKPVTTMFFCSDDEEWKEKVNTILGENNQTSEANN